jgi:DNA-directed RNA polymerase specialized sigma24 family protein
MSAISSLQGSISSESKYTGTFTQLPNHTEELNPSSSRSGLESILTACLQHVGRWSVPPNWSPVDWRHEAAQVAALAGLEAMLDYDGAGGRSFEYFVAQRMTSRVRTHYRREWTYALRFGWTQVCSRIKSSSGKDRSEDSDWIAATTELDPGWQEIREAILQLPTAYQSILVDIFWNGYTEVEIGAMLKVSQCAVNKRKQAGLRALRGKLRSAA